MLSTENSFVTVRSSSLSSYRQKRATSKSKNLNIQQLQQNVSDLEKQFQQLNSSKSHKQLKTQSSDHTLSFNDSFNQFKECSGVEFDGSPTGEVGNVSISKKIEFKYNNFNENILEVEDDYDNLENHKLVHQRSHSKLTQKIEGPTTAREKIVPKKNPSSKFLMKKNSNVINKKPEPEKMSIIKKLATMQSQVLKYLGKDKRKQQRAIQLFSQLLGVMNEQ